MTIGSKIELTRTISESDVYDFGELTGDLGLNHLDKEYSRSTFYGQRVLHGAFLVGLASAAATRYGERFDKGRYRGASYGYDRVRFVRPVFIGDTVTIEYVITDMDPITLRSLARVTGTKQDGEVCFIAVHLSQGLQSPQRDGGIASTPRKDFA